MATGTGKTITALASAVRLYARERRLVLVIACPYQHLVDQWHDEATHHRCFRRAVFRKPVAAKRRR